MMTSTHQKDQHIQNNTHNYMEIAEKCKGTIHPAMIPLIRTNFRPLFIYLYFLKPIEEDIFLSGCHIIIDSWFFILCIYIYIYIPILYITLVTQTSGSILFLYLAHVVRIKRSKNEDQYSSKIQHNTYNCMEIAEKCKATIHTAMIPLVCTNCRSLFIYLYFFKPIEEDIFLSGCHTVIDSRKAKLIMFTWGCKSPVMITNVYRHGQLSSVAFLSEAWCEWCFQIARFNWWLPQQDANFSIAIPANRNI